MAGKILEMKEKVNLYLHDSKNPWTSILTTAEQKTGVDRLYIFVGGFALIGLWLVFGYAAQLVCNTIGFLYPAYISIHAIESKNKDDDTKWLTYWVVFAIFSVVEYFGDIIVRWFPLYWLVKCIFLIWLMIPSQLNGATMLYKKVILPYFVKHKASIDDTIHKVQESASKLLEKNQ